MTQKAKPNRKLNYIDIANCIVYNYNLTQEHLSKFHLSKVLGITLSELSKQGIAISGKDREGKIKNLYNNFNIRESITNYEYPKEVFSLEEFWEAINWKFDINDMPKEVFVIVNQIVKTYIKEEL